MDQRDYGFGIPELPYISGREATGIVVKAPKNSSRIKVDDQVREYYTHAT